VLPAFPRCGEVSTAGAARLGGVGMDILTWLIVGLVAGALASFVVGGG
jgi:hypothetical protein